MLGVIEHKEYSDFEKHEYTRNGGGNEEQKPEELNKRALAIIQRVKDKLTGNDFKLGDTTSVDVAKQVELLIDQATSHENLCQCYIGWCPFW